MADAVVVGIKQENFGVSRLPVDDYVQGAEPFVLCEALYPHSQLSLGSGLYHHQIGAARSWAFTILGVTR